MYCSMKCISWEIYDSVRSVRIAHKPLVLWGCVKPPYLEKEQKHEKANPEGWCSYAYVDDGFTT